MPWFWKRTLTSAVLVSVLLAPNFPAFAQLETPTSTTETLETDRNLFDPDFVLNDDDIFDLGAMNLADIQAFLSQKGTLGHYRTKDIDGIEKSAAEIIWRVATSYKLNPRYLLALLQKEQSLVEDPRPTQRQFDWATGYAICDNCSKDDPSLQDFKGFANQLEWAAKQHREKYLLQILGKGKTIAGQAPGKTVLIDGQAVTPANNATAMLYSYTPHLAGNRNLWRIWQRWYSLTFPEGTLVRGQDSRTFYLLRYGEKRPIQSLAVASSMMDPSKIVNVNESQLSGYRLGNAISFANYSLVKSNDRIYLLVGSQKRLITDAAFNRFGFNSDEVIETDETTLEEYTDGPDITVQTTYPTGLLVKDPKGAYWYIENAIRHPLPDKQFLTLYFRQRVAKSWTQKQLDAVPVGTPYQLQDGELVRSKDTTTVYVIENGMRRPFVSGSDFEELGFAWKNVIVLPASLLNNYPVGAVVDPHPTYPNAVLTLAPNGNTAASSTVSSAMHPLTP